MLSKNLNLLYILLAGKQIAERLRMSQADLTALANDYCKRQTGYDTLQALQSSNEPEAKVNTLAGDIVHHIMYGNLHLMRPPVTPAKPAEPMPDPTPKPVDPTDLRAIVHAEMDELLKCLVIQSAHQMQALKDDIHRLMAMYVRSLK